MKSLNGQDINLSYCIPLDLRDEQIRYASRVIKERFASRLSDGTEGPVAIVGFGPSLQDTWPQISGFPKIITCSGSHKFLIERCIIPNWHVEVDPRKHKIELLGQPHPDV